jgi:hypothetical protein
MPTNIRSLAAASALQTQEGRPWKRAALWLAFLGPFFFLTYGFANWWTARLPQVGSFWFAWEKQIPFLDWTILPYMSIDAFYAASLFVCASKAELDTHARRLLAATLISVTGFLLFPLQFSFVRPPTSGFNGALFDILTGFDKPFNQAPSLHISLLMLLWIVYARHLRGAWRWLLHIWFFLIGLSVFTTFQHHVIDGITGVVAGIFCLYLFPDAPLQWSRGNRDDEAGRLRLHRYYLLGSTACFALAGLIGGWAWLLLWPGVSLSLVALAYGWLGESVFQKHEGQQSRAARVLLLPYQAGAWLSSRWFTRAGDWSTEVVPGVWIGRAPGAADWKILDAPAVLDLTAEFDAGSGAAARRYRSVPMLDLVAPTPAQLQRAVAALDALHPYAPVLVHCALGYSRSALVIAAWLLKRGVASTPEQAIAIVSKARPRIVLPDTYRRMLEGMQGG